MGFGRHQPPLRESPHPSPLLIRDVEHRAQFLQIFGPNLHEVDKPESLNTSSLTWFNLFFKPTFTEPELLYGGGWVDVRDVAEAHAVALEKEEAGGERIAISSPAVPNQEFIEAAKRAAVSLGIESVQTGVQNYDPTKGGNYVSWSKAKRDRILGIKMTSVDDSVRDAIANFKERGWVPVSRL